MNEGRRQQLKTSIQNVGGASVPCCNPKDGCNHHQKLRPAASTSEELD